MLKTVLIIVLSVALFGISFFLIVKKSLKKHLDFYLEQEIKKKSKKNN